MGLILFCLFLGSLPNGELTITTCHGDNGGIVVQTPQGHAMLIIRGYDSQVSVCLGKTRPFWDKTLDLLIAVGSKKEIVQATEPIVSRYRVNNILAGEEVLSSPEYRDAIKASVNRSLGGFPISFSARVTVPGLVAKILPLPSRSIDVALNADQSSTNGQVVFFEYGKTRALIFPPSASQEDEDRVVSMYADSTPQLFVVRSTIPQKERLLSEGSNNHTISLVPERVFSSVFLRKNGHIFSNKQDQTVHSNGQYWRSTSKQLGL